MISVLLVVQKGRVANVFPQLSTGGSCSTRWSLQVAPRVLSIMVWPEKTAMGALD